MGSLRRRLHDGRIRLRRLLTRALDARTDSSAQAHLQARIRTLLGTEASQSQWYDVMRELLLTRPVPSRLLADLLPATPLAKGERDLVSRLLTRPHGIARSDCVHGEDDDVWQ